MRTPALLALLLLASCDDGKGAPHSGGLDDDTGDSVPIDADRDGYTANEDCDDEDANTNPGVEEDCDGLDNNCNELIDEGVEGTWYDDADGDGFGDDASAYGSCDGDGGVPVAGDCDDADPYIYPDAEEICDGIDNNCDGSIDEGSGADAVYRDADGDGYGDPDSPSSTCGDLEGTVSNSDDCDDGDAAIHPDADEICDGLDNDCDGVPDDDAIDALTWYLDADADLYGDDAITETACTAPDGYAAYGGDCDESNSEVNPGTSEQCDDLDNDCDGVIDEDIVYTWYTDADGDAHGDPLAVLDTCDPPAGSSAVGDDCDDEVPTTFPGADELCNEADDDCDGEVDEDAVESATWYYDDDADGYGDPLTFEITCERPEEFVTNGDDCDDLNPSVNPGADEICDDLDNDCDGEIDEAGEGATTWYGDADGDGYGDDSVTSDACAPPDGYVEAGGDCDDGDPAYNPGADESDCSDPNDYNCDGSSGYDDDDGDGYSACEECDDGDASINPDGVEVCDGLDNDCDGEIDGADSADLSTWYADEDGDGYGDPGAGVEACEAPDGAVADGTDCDDGEPGVHPGGLEVCDGLDNDCDGAIDDDADGVVTWYRDEDGDGYGDPGAPVESCDAVAGTVADDTDCDDGAADAHPGAPELCGDDLDNDCDGSTDEGDAIDASTWYRDADGDGYGDEDSSARACAQPSGYRATALDCDDDDDGINPDAAELCDGLDNDCDGAVDDGATDATTWYADADGDGYGDPSASTAACTRPSGYRSDDSDCDDDDDAVNPGETEICNGVDDDCDGRIDGADAADATEWYADLDDDGFGDADRAVTACDPPSGYLADDTDCDDLDADVNPDATETCDGEDNDCDGATDEAGSTGSTTWYQDTDDDGYGDSGVSVTACDPPSGYVEADGDCDDDDPDYNPGMDELCTDREDYNCDGSIGYTDADGDDVAACEDCDDDDATSYPGATETCDGADNDCDGSVDESGASGESTWYRDGDADGYGDPSSAVSACDRPAGYVANRTDCDDTDADTHPGGVEVCDGEDNDCDGSTDEDAADADTWYRDRDSDGFGDDSTTKEACDKPSGYVSDDSDCDDTDADVNPDADELCNDIDDDCDGAIDTGALDALTWHRDADSDGFGDDATTRSACDAPAGYTDDSTDCDDTDADINPDADEVCDGADNDCDSRVDESDAIDASTWYYDDDGDGYGDPDLSTRACDAPSSYVALDTDCDDSLSGVNPGATDVCDGLDNDCSGAIDDGGTCDGDCEVEYYGDGTYLFCGTARSWTDGQTWCESFGYHMLDVYNAAENTWAVDTANSYSTAKWWIGFNDRATEGSFVWESGAAVTYTNWHAGEPNDAGGEDCTQFNRFSDDSWNDEPCTSSFRFICEL